MKIIIIGAGVAGTWLTRAALDAGHDVVLISDGNRPAASAVALAVMRPSWLPREDRPLLKRSMELYAAHGIENYAGALVSRWDREGTVEQADWRAVAPYHPDLSGADLRTGEARPLAPTMVIWGNRALVEEADVVVWCDGVGDPATLTYGSTWVHADPDALAFLGEPIAPSIRVHHLAPYKTLSAVRYNDGARLGSSSARTLNKALDQADKMLDEAVELGWTPSCSGWRRLDGVRVKRDELLVRDDEVGWRWGGFHRNGYALAPALAADVVERIEGEELL